MQALEPYTNQTKAKKDSQIEYEHVEAKLKTDKEEEAEEEERRNNDPWATLSKSEWEAIRLYLVYAFVKDSENTKKG